MAMIPDWPWELVLKADRMVTHGVENIPYLVYVDHHIYAQETRFHDVARL